MTRSESDNTDVLLIVAFNIYNSLQPQYSGEVMSPKCGSQFAFLPFRFPRLKVCFFLNGFLVKCLKHRLKIFRHFVRQHEIH